MRLSREELKGLMKNKLIQAGLREDHADQTAEILTWAHEKFSFYMREDLLHMVLFVLSITVRESSKAESHMSQTSHGIRQVLAQESWMETMVSVTG